MDNEQTHVTTACKTCWGARKLTLRKPMKLGGGIAHEYPCPDCVTPHLTCTQFRDGKCVRCGALDPLRPVPPQYYPGAEHPIVEKPRGDD